MRIHDTFYVIRILRASARGETMKSRIMNFRIDPTLYRALQLVAQKRNVTTSKYIRELVCRELLKEIEGEGRGGDVL